MNDQEILLFDISIMSIFIDLSYLQLKDNVNISMIAIDINELEGIQQE